MPVETSITRAASAESAHFTSGMNFRDSLRNSHTAGGRDPNIIYIYIYVHLHVPAQLCGARAASGSSMHRFGMIPSVGNCVFISFAVVSSHTMLASRNAGACDASKGSTAAAGDHLRNKAQGSYLRYVMFIDLDVPALRRKRCRSGRSALQDEQQGSTKESIHSSRGSFIYLCLVEAPTPDAALAPDAAGLAAVGALPKIT